MGSMVLVLGFPQASQSFPVAPRGSQRLSEAFQRPPRDSQRQETVRGQKIIDLGREVLTFHRFSLIYLAKGMGGVNICLKK